MLYQTKWEILPPKTQMVVMLLIHRKQNEKGLSLGPFGMGINRESFKLVYALNFFGTCLLFSILKIILRAFLLTEFDFLISSQQIRFIRS